MALFDRFFLDPPDCPDRESHAERRDGLWSLPLDHTGALGVLICVNGARQVRWWCFTCRFKSGPIPHGLVSARGIDVNALPVLQDNEATR